MVKQRVAVLEKTPIEKARDSRVAALIKEFDEIDKEAVMHFDDDGAHKIPTLSSGIVGIDEILGGGFPLGRLSELFGTEGSGKTTLCIHTMIAAQRAGNVAVFIDVEHAFNPVYAHAIGLDLSALVMVTPKNGEEAFTYAIKAAERASRGDVIVMDSIAALAPKSEIDGEMEDKAVAVLPRLVGKGLNKLIDAVSKSQVAMIFINQLRDKIGVVYGSPESTPGGRALKFLSSLRLRVGQVTMLKDGDKQAYGHVTRVKTAKNKIFAPQQEVDTPLLYGVGFSRVDSIIDTAIKHELLVRAGAYFTWKGLITIDGGEEKKFQGKEAIISFFNECPENLERMEAELRSKLFGGTT